MRNKKRLWTLILAAAFASLLLLYFWTRPHPHGVRFSKLSTSPPHVIYHRGHYVPIPAGKLLYSLESFLERRGYDPDLVSAQHFSFENDWCVLLGLKGPMIGRYIARIKTSHSTNEIHMTGAWSTLDSTEHLIFWRLKPVPPDRGRVTVELIDQTSNTLLATHSVSPD